jgi:hypothetical protein
MFALKEHVANVCFKCFKDMLQAFYIDAAKVDRDIAKVDRDVAHVAIAKYTCCKCYRCFRRMLQIFHLDVLKINLGVAHVAMTIYTRMFQVFHMF